MNKTVKIFLILMIVLMLAMIATPVFAAVKSGDAIDSVESKINAPNGTDSFTTKVGKIIGFCQWAGAIAGVLILTVFGIKYMVGSLEEKAEYKKTMIPFFIGTAVLILAPQIAKLIFSIVE